MRAELRPAEIHADITVVDAFLGAADCRRMLAEAEAERGAWVASGVEGRVDAGRASGRSSESLMLARGFSPWGAAFLARTEARLAALLGVDPRRLEPWQLVRYRRGAAYGDHLDCGAWARHPSGERARTLMLVLEQPASGGATRFRALARTIRPLAGRLVAWRNLLPGGGCDHAMIHAGRPVWRGRKTILVTWERQRDYVET